MHTHTHTHTQTHLKCVRLSVPVPCPASAARRAGRGHGPRSRLRGGLLPSPAIASLYALAPSTRAPSPLKCVRLSVPVPCPASGARRAGRGHGPRLRLRGGLLPSPAIASPHALLGARTRQRAFTHPSTRTPSPLEMRATVRARHVCRGRCSRGVCCSPVMTAGSWTSVAAVSARARLLVYWVVQPRGAHSAALACWSPAPMNRLCARAPVSHRISLSLCSELVTYRYLLQHIT